MRGIKTHRRVILLASYLAAGAMVLQLGSCLGMALTSGAAAFDVSSLLDENQMLFGVFAPCGRPNTLEYDRERYEETGVFSSIGDLMGAEDDLIQGCPFEWIPGP